MDNNDLLDELKLEDILNIKDYSHIYEGSTPIVIRLVNFIPDDIATQKLFAFLSRNIEKVEYWFLFVSISQLIYFCDYMREQKRFTIKYPNKFFFMSDYGTNDYNDILEHNKRENNIYPYQKLNDFVKRGIFQAHLKKHKNEKQLSAIINLFDAENTKRKIQASPSSDNLSSRQSISKRDLNIDIPDDDFKTLTHVKCINIVVDNLSFINYMKLLDDSKELFHVEDHDLMFHSHVYDLTLVIIYQKAEEIHIWTETNDGCRRVSIKKKDFKPDFLQPIYKQLLYLIK